MESPGRLAHRSLPVHEPAPGHCLVAVEHVGLCGTDLGFYTGTSSYLHTGRKSYPFVLGHEWSGEIVLTGEGVTGLREGDRVSGHNFRRCGSCAVCAAGGTFHCPYRTEMGVVGEEPGAASEYLSVPAETVHRIPDGVDNRAAALLEPCSASVHALRRLAISGADSVAILGAGTLGLAAAQLAVSRGASVTVLDPNPRLASLAAELGTDRVAAPDEVRSGNYDVVVEASGASEAVRQAIRLCGQNARLAQLGTPHGPVDAVPVDEAVGKNLVTHNVLSGADHWPQLLEEVASGNLRLEPMIDRAFSFHEADKAFERLNDSGRDRPKVLLNIR